MNLFRVLLDDRPYGFAVGQAQLDRFYDQHGHDAPSHQELETAEDKQDWVNGALYVVVRQEREMFNGEPIVVGMEFGNLVWAGGDGKLYSADYEEDEPEEFLADYDFLLRQVGPSINQKYAELKP